MRQSQQGIFRFIFGADGEKHAQLLVRLAVLLHLGVRLCCSSFLSNLNALLSVVTDDTAPQGVVQIQRQHLFVFAIDGADDAGQAVGELRNCRKRQSILIQIPVRGILPCVQSVAGGEILNIMEIEVRVRGGILGKPAVQLVDEPDHAMAVPGLPVSHQPVGGKFEVVLQNGTMIGLL